MAAVLFLLANEDKVLICVVFTQHRTRLHLNHLKSVFIES